MFTALLFIARKNRIVSVLLLLVGNVFLSTQNRQVLRFKLEDGDKTLRINYPLNEDSIVFDVGGYIGNWSNDVYKKYGCNIYIFEPVEEYYEFIKKRFRNVKKIHVFKYGLGGKTETSTLHLSKDATSVYGKSDKLEKVRLVSILEVLQKNKIKTVDLVKLNIEGGEYELLESLIQAKSVKKFKNFQIQFHQIMPNSRARMHAIQNVLKKTHRITYQYTFVWENWLLKK